MLCKSCVYVCVCVCPHLPSWVFWVGQRGKETEEKELEEKPATHCCSCLITACHTEGKKFIAVTNVIELLKVHEATALHLYSPAGEAYDSNFFPYLFLLIYSSSNYLSSPWRVGSQDPEGTFIDLDSAFMNLASWLEDIKN